MCASTRSGSVPALGPSRTTCGGALRASPATWLSRGSLSRRVSSSARFAFRSRLAFASWVRTRSRTSASAVASPSAATSASPRARWAAASRSSGRFPTAVPPRLAAERLSRCARSDVMSSSCSRAAIAASCVVASRSDRRRGVHDASNTGHHEQAVGGDHGAVLGASWPRRARRGHPARRDGEPVGDAAALRGRGVGRTEPARDRDRARDRVRCGRVARNAMRACSQTNPFGRGELLRVLARREARHRRARRLAERRPPFRERARGRHRSVEARCARRPRAPAAPSATRAASATVSRARPRSAAIRLRSRSCSLRSFARLAAVALSSSSRSRSDRSSSPRRISSLSRTRCARSVSTRAARASARATRVRDASSSAVRALSADSRALRAAALASSSRVFGDPQTGGSPGSAA